jgi:hypothetical protein
VKTRFGASSSGPSSTSAWTSATASLSVADSFNDSLLLQRLWRVLAEYGGLDRYRALVLD